jgi:hypothetical protein
MRQFSDDQRCGSIQPIVFAMSGQRLIADDLFWFGGRGRNCLDHRRT